MLTRREIPRAPGSARRLLARRSGFYLQSRLHRRRHPCGPAHDRLRGGDPVRPVARQGGWSGLSMLLEAVGTYSPLASVSDSLPDSNGEFRISVLDTCVFP